MPSYFVVVKYLVGDLREEVVNVGVIAYNEATEEKYTNFLKNWERVANFAGKDHIDFLKSEINYIENLSFEKTVEFMKEAISPGPYTTIVCTPPRGSILPAKELFESIKDRFILDEAPKKITQRPLVADSGMKYQLTTTLTSISCNSDRCSFKKECAQHVSAGQFREESGFTPEIEKSGDNYMCNTFGRKSSDDLNRIVPDNIETLNHGMLYFSKDKELKVYGGPYEDMEE